MLLYDRTRLDDQQGSQLWKDDIDQMLEDDWITYEMPEHKRLAWGEEPPTREEFG
jgi:hypothetical protein